MVVIAEQSESPAWYQCLAEPAEEFPLTPLTVLEGAIPERLKGSLYRNGPARFKRGGAKVNHWFDGDGAVLAVHLAEGQARATYRFVQTKEYQEETKAETLLYGGYGTLPAVGLWNQLAKLVKNAANTSVLALPDRLLALWEGGKPHSLDLEDLTTLGLDNLDFLSEEQTFSAHPKQDPISGEIYNFGIGVGRKNKLFIYRCDRYGKVIKQNTLPLKGIPMVHDCVMAGPYLVFCIPPVRLQNPVKILLGLSAYSDCWRWKSMLGTRILVVDRETLELLNEGELEPWFQWHFGNGHVTPQGHLSFTLSRYQDFQTNQFLKEVASGKLKTVAEASLWQCELNLDTMNLVAKDVLVDQVNEFPTVSPLEVGRKETATYFSVNHDSTPQLSLLQNIGRYEHQTGQLQMSQLPDTHYAMEPLFAPDRSGETDGWILTVVYDSDRHQSEVWIFAAKQLETPICRLGLPSVIPIGFHGQWVAA